MEVFKQLNYGYPGSPGGARSHVPQQPQPSPSLPYMPVPNYNQPVQDQSHPEYGYACSDPCRTAHARSSVDLTASRLSPRQRKTPLIAPRGGVSYPKRPIEICHTDETLHLVDQYVPSANDRITCTDHRPLDAIFGDLCPPSELLQAVSSPSHALQNGRPHGPPRHTTVRTYTLPSKPEMDGVLHIPLLAVDNQMGGTGLVVDFRCSDWGIGVRVEGIPMSDLLHGNISGLESPHERVLDGLGITNLRFNILWPHYPPFAKVISSFGTDGKPITRAELGYEASLAFAEFFYYITSHSILPVQPSPYGISASPPGSFPPGIKFEQLQLITVRNTSRGEWMAEIRAVSIS